MLFVFKTVGFWKKNKNTSRILFLPTRLTYEVVQSSVMERRLEAISPVFWDLRAHLSLHEAHASSLFLSLRKAEYPPRVEVSSTVYLSEQLHLEQSWLVSGAWSLLNEVPFQKELPRPETGKGAQSSIRKPRGRFPQYQVPGLLRAQR